MNLDALLNPQTIAIIGASRQAGKVGHEILANLVKGGFPGALVPVNPRAGEILGIPCWPDLKSWGKPIDLAVVAVAADQVREAVMAALDAGAFAVAVITSGFKEKGPEAAAREAELAKLCAGRGSRLLGPNCLGVINTHERMNASFARDLPPAGGISVVSQSGALIAAILDWARSRQVGFAKVVSIGNKADLSEIDLLRAFARDERTRVIVGYLESITRGEEFVRAAAAAAAEKPVVIYKAGVTTAGFRGVAHHTGGQAGADVAYGAAFQRAGVIRADSFEALFDYATALALQPLPRGRRVAILTNAGGPGVMAADAVEKMGLEVPLLGEATAGALRAALPPAASVANPVDVMGDAGPERFALGLAALRDDPAVDAVLVVLTPQAMTGVVEIARALVAAAAGGGKPVLASFMGGDGVAGGSRELVAAGIPDYPSPERAAAALKAMHDLHLWRSRPPRAVTRFPANRRRVDRILRRHLRTGRLQLGELAAKELVQCYGFVTPPGALAGDAEEAVELAEKLGFPVTLKAASPDLPQRRAGVAVRPGLTTAGAVRDACELIQLQVPRRFPGARLDGIYVEHQVTAGQELMIGMIQDPQFGPLLGFGLGGLAVEMMGDATFYLAPVTAEEAMEMLQATRTYERLAGEEAEEAVDLQAVAAGLQRLSQLGVDFPSLAEVEVNPFLVGPSGVEPVAGGVRAILGEAGRMGGGR